MDKLEKKIDRRMKGIEEAIELIKREVREMREMIIGMRDEEERDEDGRKERREEEKLEKEQENID